MSLAIFMMQLDRGAMTKLAKGMLSQKAKYWVKHILGALCLPRHPFKKPIFLFSTRRSGSTLFLEMLHSNKGVNYSAQSLDFWHHHPYRDRLPQPYLNRFVSLEPKEAERLATYFRLLSEGRIRVNSQWNVLSSSYSFLVDRIVITLLNAKPLMDWFAEQFDAEIIYLVRHPIPTALSIIHRNWGHTARAFLEDTHFRQAYLDDDSVARCYRILETGSALEKHVLEWGLENVIPLSVFQKRSWLAVTYEELIARPDRMCQLLAARLNLPNPQRMRRSISKPSRTARSRSATDILEEGPEYLLERWRTEVDQDAAHSAIRILKEILGIRFYTADGLFPDKSLCHFGPLELEKI